MSEPKVFANIKVCLEEKEEQDHYNKYQMTVSYTVRSCRTYTCIHTHGCTHRVQYHTVNTPHTYIPLTYSQTHMHTASMQHTNRLHIFYCVVVCKMFIIYTVYMEMNRLTAQLLISLFGGNQFM